MPTPKPSSETPKIRLVFMGTPSFAEPILEALIEEKYHIVAVYTRPDKPSGRSQSLAASPIKTLAQSHNFPLEQPDRFDEKTIRTLQNYRPDIIIVAAFGKILPKAVLNIPGFGCINVHPSLLPKFRGPSPIQNALLSGDIETGTSLMLMDEGMDTGDLLAQEKVMIEPEEMFPNLSKRLGQKSAELLIKTLPQWIGRTIHPQKQDSSQATLCQLIEREDGHILWTSDAKTIFNAFRALSPWPGLYGFWNRDHEQLLRIKFIRIALQKQTPETAYRLGEVFQLGEKIGVRASSGVIFLEEVQMEGKGIVTIEEFIKGYPQFIGSVLQ